MRRVVFALALVAAGSAARGEPIVGLTVQNTLVIFDTAAPGTVSAPVPITGTGGAQILGIDYRPANGQLYGVGSNNGIYVLNPTTGAVTQVATFSTPLAGGAFGVDFNPVPDRLRTVSATGQNLRTNVDTGAVITDGPLNPGTPRATGAAYTNSFAGATSTTLYVIDSAANTLSIQNPPNNGTQVPVGPLGVDVPDDLGFDISGVNGAAFAAFTGPNGGPSGLYSINLATGAATFVGPIGSGAALRGLAIPTANAAPLPSPIPEPTTLAAFAGLAAVAGLARHRRRSGK